MYLFGIICAILIWISVIISLFNLYITSTTRNKRNRYNWLLYIPIVNFFILLYFIFYIVYKMITEKRRTHD